MKYAVIFFSLIFGTQLFALDTNFLDLKRSKRELLRISTWKMEITGADQTLKGIYHGQVIVTLTCKNNSPDSLLFVNGEETGMKAKEKKMNYKECKSLSDEIWFKGHNVARPIYVMLQEDKGCQGKPGCEHIIQYIGNTKPKK